MPTLADLKKEYIELQDQLVLINAQIRAVIKSKNKKYAYDTVEAKHVAELQSLGDLLKTKQAIRAEMAVIESQIGGIFVQFKNT